MIKKLLQTAFFILVSFSASLAQQGQGGIKGKISDKGNGQEIPFASIIVEFNGNTVASGQSDFNGDFVIKPLQPGTYTVKATFVGYQTLMKTGVVIEADKTRQLNLELANTGVDIKTVVVEAYKVPVIDPESKGGRTVTKEMYNQMAVKDIGSVVATSAGVGRSDERSGDINIRGQRGTSTNVFIDGERVIGSSAIPQRGVEQISVITSGLPAQYGNVTGGVINVTTQGPRSDFAGGIEAISSQLTDKYGYNFVGGNFGGPIITKKDSNGVKQTVLGFFLSGQATTDKDPSPSAIGAWSVNKDTLDYLQKNPVRLIPGKEGVYRNSEFLKQEDLVHTPYRLNVRSNDVALNGKIEYVPVKNLTFTVGGTYTYNKNHDYTYEYSLLNSENNAQITDKTWRVWGRVTQKFGDETKNKEKTASNITNAYFSLQAGYQKQSVITEDDTHGDNFFNYGYVGKFDQKRGTFIGGFAPVDPLDATKSAIYQVVVDSVVNFTPSDVNPNTTSHTSQYYELYKNQPEYMRNVNTIQFYNGMVNGTRPQLVYSLWHNTGRQYGGYSNESNSQFRVFTSFSADLFKKHAVQIGFEYEQRDQSFYSTNSIDIWGLMRQLANKQIGDFDSKNLTYVKTIDTTNYYMVGHSYDMSAQTTFDKNLREKLGITDAKQVVNTDQYDPSTYSYEMFSADELLQFGSTAFVSYYGFDKNGKKTNAKPSFDDFFTAKDDKGNLKREVGSFNPIYMSGYIEDKFDYKDLKFRVGLRVDRYDANQKVLKDPYSLYETVKAGEVKGLERPSNIGDDFIVYVADFNNPNKDNVLGYRDPNSGFPAKWYNKDGSLVQDLQNFSKLTTTGKIAPWTVDPANSLNPSKDLSSKAFTDYIPQVNFMPRISFSFPISDVANFYAHYDILTQRPTGFNRLDVVDYFNIMNPNNTFVNNPDLKPEKTIDYELGFQQALNESKSAGLTLAAFYKENRDMINSVQLVQAYPITYTTFANVDFGTVKGLTVTYDLRRTGNVSLNASYTLQFATGTGSSNSSSFALINAGSANLRTPIPLDYDQRHNIVANVDYRYADGADYDGPVLFGKQILANFGGNLQVSASSGTPYSYQSNITTDVSVGVQQRSQLVGQLNSARKPWNYRLDLRLDKSITLKAGKKDQDGGQKTYNLNVYLQILNLLNTVNVLNVYRYTGSPASDGYLNAPVAQSSITTQISPIAYRDLYSIKANDPANYGLPRRARIGVSFDF